MKVQIKLKYLQTVKNPPANAQHVSSMPELGRSPGEGSSNSLQYSCLEISMDRGAWWATIHGVAKSRTQLSNFTFTSQVQFLGQEDLLEKGIATHSSILAWRIP